MIDPFRHPWQTWARLTSRRLLEHSIRHDGVKRGALLYVPRHAPRGALPLVLMFHGGASSPEAIARRCQLHRVAEREGFMVAYPGGTPGKSGLTWNPSGTKGARKANDAGFVRQLIADLQRQHDIDPTRIFAAGFSIGGSLAYELACVLSDRIAAVAVVSGTMITTICSPTCPVPVLHIHGTADRRVPLEGGRGPGTRRSAEWPPVRNGITRWCEINRCGPEPLVTRFGIRGVTSNLYTGAADVELWLVEGCGHAWPGGRRKAQAPGDKPESETGLSASEKIWDFFASHPRIHRPAFETSVDAQMER